MVYPAIRRSQTGTRVRRRLLVQDSEQLAHCARQGLDQARKLVAGGLLASVQKLAYRAGSQGAGVQRDLRGPAGGLEDRFRECLSVRPYGKVQTGVRS